MVAFRKPSIVLSSRAMSGSGMSREKVVSPSMAHHVTFPSSSGPVTYTLGTIGVLKGPLGTSERLKREGSGKETLERPRSAHRMGCFELIVD